MKYMSDDDLLLTFIRYVIISLILFLNHLYCHFSCSLVVMANDRYQAIVHPFSSYTWSHRSGLIHMIGVWCLSLLLASPQLFIFRLAHHSAYDKET